MTAWAHLNGAESNGPGTGADGTGFSDYDLYIHLARQYPFLPRTPEQTVFLNSPTERNRTERRALFLGGVVV